MLKESRSLKIINQLIAFAYWIHYTRIAIIGKRAKSLGVKSKPLGMLIPKGHCTLAVSALENASRRQKNKLQKEIAN